MRYLTLALVTFSVFIGVELNAISLDAARAQGVVCEGNNGFLVAQGAASSDVQQLISTVNAQRTQEYQNIQSSNGSSLTDVMSIAAQQIAGSVPSGTYIMDASGNCAPK
ncbi:YdbL family protein [Candidatus Bealeia paramacronuclearis]|uniref:YdbL family protein n=1 Tax=Candidatus Bealeia paramacronuclearis TaxID=1921001 RepID=A0ABZ2C349_9PROT|nr:YdbL family protein [Candidatus Bealeia paramacronuclearis]